MITIRFRRFSLLMLSFASFLVIWLVSFSKGHVITRHLLFRYAKLLYHAVFSAIPIRPFFQSSLIADNILVFFSSDLAYTEKVKYMTANTAARASRNIHGSFRVM